MISGDILKQKANDIASDLGIADFNNNSRWILLFQTRHQIQLDRFTIYSTYIAYSHGICM